jgi:hypothetical protein
MRAMVEQRLTQYDQVWMELNNYDEWAVHCAEVTCACKEAQHLIVRLRAIMGMES